MSRILIWSPNYAPELTGIPPLVTDAAEYLADRGHEVEIVTAFPNYPERTIHEGYRGSIWRSERRGKVDVHRSWLRVKPGERFADKILYEASFTALSLPRVIRRARRADVLVCVVPSLLAAAASAGLARGGGGRASSSGGRTSFSLRRARSTASGRSPCARCTALRRPSGSPSVQQTASSPAAQGSSTTSWHRARDPSGS